MKGENKKVGFTIIELLTVMAIIALLVWILIPSMNRARIFARNTRQQAQLTAIDMAITLFKNDYGDYPPSNQSDEDPASGNKYNGAQKLAEAMVGQDMLGFHPNSAWRDDGTNPSLVNPNLYNRQNFDAGTLNQRVGPYLDPDKTKAFKLSQVFNNNLAEFQDNLVLCDSFTKTKVQIGEEYFKVGLPILYYKAKTSNTQLGGGPNLSIYTYFSNIDIIELKKNVYGGNEGRVAFFQKFQDPKATLAASGVLRPYRADSYILISAGADGVYFTADYVTNFGN